MIWKRKGMQCQSKHIVNDYSVDGSVKSWTRKVECGCTAAKNGTVNRKRGAPAVNINIKG